MPNATYNKFNCFAQDVTRGVHNFASDTLKICLSNTAPAATNAVLADITEISAGNGYSVGGAAVTVTSDNQTSGTLKLICQDVVFTFTGAVGPFRYAILYNSTPTSPLKPLIGWWDYGASTSEGSGETFTVHPDATNGVLQLS